MIIYLDTETTGLYPGNICQLSYIIETKEDVKIKNFYFCVDYVEPSAQSVHGLSVEVLKELSSSLRFSNHIDEIQKDLSSAELIISHNTAFDLMFLRREFENNNRVLNIKESFCSMKKMTPVCKLLRSNKTAYKYPKLSELCGYFGITDSEILNATRKVFGEPCGYHDARFDTTALYLAMTKGRMTEESLSGLEKYL